jgi:predicted nuclease with TOPRIM domain
MTNKAIIHDIVVERLKLNAEIKKLNSELSAKKKELMEIDTNLLQEMNEAQQTLTRIEGHTVSVSEQKVFTPTDWTDFYEYVEENKMSYLFQRRLTQKAVEEAVSLHGSAIPVEKFIKRSISVRKVS